MTIPGDIIIPALTFRTPDGALDEATTTAYAEAAASTWLDYFILSGTTTEGETFTADERAQVLDLWLKATDASRLVACCWERADIDAALERGIRPMAVMRGLRDEEEAIAFFRTLPAGAFVYSHPIHTAIELTPGLLLRAYQSIAAPSGAKVSKVSRENIRQIRAQADPSFVLWDGSARNLERSMQLGASGVVATPLAILPHPFPAPTVNNVSETLAIWQLKVDEVPSNLRATWMRSQALPATVGEWRLRAGS